MMEFISSELGVSMNAKPFDSWVSGLRITLTSSYTRFSELSQDLISSLVTQTGRFPRNTVKLIYFMVNSVGDLRDTLRGCDPWKHLYPITRGASGQTKISCKHLLSKEKKVSE